MIRVGFCFLNLFINNYYFLLHLSSLSLNSLNKTDSQNHTSKWTIYEDFKDDICALAELICTVKTSDRSVINPKNNQLYSILSSSTIQ